MFNFFSFLRRTIPTSHRTIQLPSYPRQVHPRPLSPKMNPSTLSTPINSSRNTNHSHLFTIQLAKLASCYIYKTITPFLLHLLTTSHPLWNTCSRVPRNDKTDGEISYTRKRHDVQTFRRAGGYPRARQQFELERNPRGYRRLLRVQYQVESVGVQGLLEAQRESKQPRSIHHSM